MDDKIHSAVNHSYDKIITKTVTQDANRHTKLSILSTIEWCKGGLLPPFLLTVKAISIICSEIEVSIPTNISLLNEYEAVFEILVENDANRIMVSL